MEQKSIFPDPPYWYTDNDLKVPEIPETVTAFGQIVNPTYKELKLEDFGVEVLYKNGTKEELKDLLQQLYQTVLDLFSNLSHDNIYAKDDAQKMLIIMQNLHHLINTKFVKHQAKKDIKQLQIFMKQRMEEYDNMFKTANLA